MKNFLKDDLLKKQLFYALLAFVFILGACSSGDDGETTSSEPSETNEQNEQNEDSGESNSEHDARIQAIQAKGEVVENGGLEQTRLDIGETLITHGEFAIELVSITHSLDLIFERESYILDFLIANDTDERILVRTYDVSIDGVLLEASEYDYLQAEEVILNPEYEHTINVYLTDGDLPTLDESIEINIEINDGVFTDGSFGIIVDELVTIEF